MSTQTWVDYRSQLADALSDSGYPDYGNALYGFSKIVLMKEDNPRVGMVSRSVLYLNERLTTEEACIVARHEILHIRYGHHFRQGDRDMRVWNIATDLEISHFYSAEDVAVIQNSENLANAFYVDDDEYSQYRGDDAEAIYDKLIQQSEGDQQKQAQRHQGEGEGSSENDDQEEGEGDSPEGNPNPDESDQNQSGSCSGSGDMTDMDKPVSKNLCKKIMKAANQDPSETEQQKEQQKEQAKQKRQESQKKGSSPKAKVGTGERKESDEAPPSPPQQNPAQQDPQENPMPDFPELTDDDFGSPFGDDFDFDSWDEGGDGVGTEHAERNLRKPEPTRVKLLRSLHGVFGRQKSYAPVWTYAKPNRRYLTPPGAKETPPMPKGGKSGTVFRKGKRRKSREWLTLGVYCDVSGSMSEEKVSLALGACKEVEKLKNCAVKVHYFDTVVKDEFFSGGGTDYNVVLQHAKENGYKSIAIITDDSSDRIPAGEYEFDNLWIIGVEHSRRGDNKDTYSIGPQIVNGTVKVKHFDGFVVCTGDE